MKDGGAVAPQGPVLRILVCRSGDPSLDVISVPESVIEERFGGDTEGFVLSIYDPCQVDWWFAAPIRGIPVRVMRFGEDDDPERFLTEHHDDKRKFI